MLHRACVQFKIAVLLTTVTCVCCGCVVTRFVPVAAASYSVTGFCFRCNCLEISICVSALSSTLYCIFYYEYYQLYSKQLLVDMFLGIFLTHFARTVKHYILAAS